MAARLVENARAARDPRLSHTDAVNTIGLPADKPAARRMIRQTRAVRRDDPQVDRSSLATAYRDQVLTYLAGRPPGTITAYESWATEPPTESLIAGLLDAGWRVIVPDTLADLRLSWHDVTHPEIDLGVEGVALADVLLIPALAVDRAGFRLGQGGGCYDRTLPLRRPGVPVIAMIFDDELLERVPRESHDLPVDAVLTSGGLRTFSDEAGRIRD